MNRSYSKQNQQVIITIGLMAVGFGLLGFAIVMFGHETVLEKFFNFAAIPITGMFAILRTDGGGHPTGEPSDPVSTRDAPKADPVPADTDTVEEGESNGNTDATAG